MQWGYPVYFLKVYLVIHKINNYKNLRRKKQNKISRRRRKKDVSWSRNIWLIQKEIIQTSIQFFKKTKLDTVQQHSAKAFKKVNVYQ